MAQFTYDDFANKWTQTGVEMSDADQALAKKNPDAGVALIQAKQDYKNATTNQARALANANAEKIRSDYGGYKGGNTGGNFYISDDNGASSKALNGTIEQLTDKIANREDFSYDPNSDPIYQNMQKSYARESDRATEDMLGKYSAMTGGSPSSSAVTAAAQTGNYYASALADKQLDARQQALSEYNNGLNTDISKLAQLSGQKQNTITNEGLKLENAGLTLDNAGKEISNQANKVGILLNLKDYNALSAMGYDVTQLRAMENDSRAATLLNLGDFDALDRLGYDTSTLRKNQNLNIVSTLIDQHNWDALDAMGVNTTYYRTVDDQATTPTQTVSYSSGASGSSSSGEENILKVVKDCPDAIQTKLSGMTDETDQISFLMSYGYSEGQAQALANVYGGSDE